MELRPYLPPDESSSRSGVHSGMGYSYGNGGLPPNIGTIRPEDVMRPPGYTSNGMESVQGSSDASGKATSSAYNTSIHSFPSPSLNPPNITPATNSSSNQPYYSSGGISSNPPIPTSFPHLRQPNSSNPTLNSHSNPNSNSIPSPAWSSPLPHNRPSHVSSTELSSNRPLFSSTQGSGMPPITPDPSMIADVDPRQRSVFKTYGKPSRTTPSPVKKAHMSNTKELSRYEPVILSSSPTSEPLNSPFGRRSKSPNKRRKVILSDEEEEEEEEEESVEFRTPALPKSSDPSSTKSRLEVVLPKSRPPSANQERTSSSGNAADKTHGGRRGHSPDPLDSFNGQPTPAKSRHTQSTAGPSSSAISNTSRGQSVVSGQLAEPSSSSSRRSSSRVADHKVKEAAEKEERRRRRREEKERKKLEYEQTTKIAEKTKIKLTVKPIRDVAEENQDTFVANGNIQSLKQSEKGTIVEPIEIEESVVEVPPPQVVNQGKKRKSDVAQIIDREDIDGDFDPSVAKGKAKKAKKAKKEPVKKGKAASKKVVQPEPELEMEIGKDILVEQAEEVNEPQEVGPAVQENEEEVAEPTKSPTPSPVKAPSPIRPPLRTTSSNISIPSTSRPSPGPVKPNGTPSVPGGIKWKAPRNDLISVLAKFGGAKRSGLTKKHKIIPLHQKIGPPAKSLPPVPKKPEKKKVNDDDDDDDDDASEDEFGIKKVKNGKKGLEWFMVED
ncbi:uncharacterized protein IL334_007607 [Kwoniella shivajii]|uniref:Uncharacterized protein n=1 Tax=Kwoniella shivajii TaxID=564305 RepID=A0ABZ1DBD5_9TREE|nr:hypothetical protein IL334_007607 [Kwoniella shivajii]